VIRWAREQGSKGAEGKGEEWEIGEKLHAWFGGGWRYTWETAAWHGERIALHCAREHRSCRFTRSWYWLGSSGSVAHARLALSNLPWAEIMCCSIYMYASLYYSYSYNCCNRSKQSSHTLLLIVGFCYAPSSLLRFRTRGLSLAQRTSLHILPSCRRDAVL